MLHKTSHKSIDATCLFILCYCLVISSGCNRQLSQPESPNINPEVASENAIDLYDTNKDGLLDLEELKFCPAFHNSFEKIDLDGDSLITPEELERRITGVFDSQAVLIDAIAEITLANRPLTGATVTLDPEPFMGDSYKAITAITDNQGIATFSGHHPKFPGVYLGIYKVRISKFKSGKELVPEKYNQMTELGLDVMSKPSNLTQFSLAK